MPLRLAQQHALDWAQLLDIDVVHLNLSLINREFVERLHQLDFIVHGSNLDSAAQMQQGFEMGIDSLSTGHLEMALRLRDRFLAM